MRQFFIPYLLFKNTKEAIEYYNEIFEGEVLYTMLGKDTPECPEDKLDSIMHLEYKIQDGIIYMSDTDKMPSEQGLLMLDYDNLEAMKKAYNKMLPTSNVMRPLEDTFWGAVFGVLEDKYGMKWEFHYMKPKE